MRAGGVGEATAHDAEVEHLHLAVLFDHHVRRLHVAVDEPRAVRRREHARYRGAPPDPPREGHLDLAEVRRERAASDQLHRDEGDVVVLAHVEDDDGAGVLEGGRGLRLDEHARARRRVAVGAQQLERHLAAEARVPRAEHLGHAAVADAPFEDVPIEGVPRAEARGVHREGVARPPARRRRHRRDVVRVAAGAGVARRGVVDDPAARAGGARGRAPCAPAARAHAGRDGLLGGAAAHRGELPGALDQRRERDLHGPLVDVDAAREEHLREGVRELPRRPDPVRRVGGERGREDGEHVRRDVRRLRERRLQLAVRDGARKRGAAALAVRRSEPKELVEDDAERVHVAPAIHLLAAGLLRRHVPELPRLHARLVADEARARDAEVGHLHGAAARHEEVLRRDVAVDDRERLRALVAVLVRVVEPARCLLHDPQRDGHGEALAALL